MNEVTKRKGFYISLADTSDSGIFRGDESIETAICTKGKYYILNGDHTKQYAKCKTLAECMKYFRSKKSLKSSWSN